METHTQVTDDRLWKIMEDYFERYGFTKYNLDSFNNFILRTLPRLITDEPDIVVETDMRDKQTGAALEARDLRVVTVSFGNVYVPSPVIIDSDRTIKKMLPNECRIKDLTYDAPIYVSVKCVIERYGEEPIVQEYARVEIGRVPIMLMSSKCYLSNMTPNERIKAMECKFDQGGYFIVNGGERVLVGQCRDTYNVVFVFPQNSKKWSRVAEIRSMSEETGHSVQVKAMIGLDDKTLHFSLPYVSKSTIPIGMVFRAFDFTDDEIKDMIGLSCNAAAKYINLIIRDSHLVDSKEEALKIIGKSASQPIPETERISHAEKILESEIFPHLGVTSTRTERGYMLGHIVHKLIATHVGLRHEDDRDNYMNKRIETAGILMADLFRQLFKKYTDSIVGQIDKKKHDPDILSIVSRSKIITNGFSKCFGTGDWGVQIGSYMKVGVSQILSRLSYGATLSHLRRFSLTVGKEVKNAKVRQINPSSIMFVCPHECFDPSTKILMYDGSIKYARDVCVGDVLIDDKGKPTRVMSTCAGIDDSMYTIKHSLCSEFEDYTVTSNHILTLKCDDPSVSIDNMCADGTIDITIKDYINLPESIRVSLKGYKYNTLVDKGQSSTPVMQSDIKVVLKGHGSYVGWQVEGSGRFLLADNTVVHNTPEGETVGIVLNLTLMTEVSERSIVTIVKEIVNECQNITPLINYVGTSETTKVFVNGALFGFCDDAFETVDFLREQRDSGALPKDVSISYDDVDDEVHVWCDEGRLIRPVLAVNGDKLALTMDDDVNWESLVKAKKIKYIDNWEADKAVIAFSQDELRKYANDYCEISPSMMMSIMASIIPFPEHAPSPRICYISAMGKQAMGMFSLAHQHRTDTMVNVLHYPQRPLVGTRQAKIMGFNEMPTGMNAIVAVITHGGNNQEDSILLKRGSVELGMFVADSYRTHTECEEKRDANVMIKIGLPPIKKMGNDLNYGLLDKDGVVRERHDDGSEVWVEENDVIIGKIVVVSNKDGQDKIDDCSAVIKKGEEGFVDKVYKKILPSGHLMVKVKIRSKKIPEIGDKFVTRGAQKGTTGDIVDDVDMPFTDDGIIPDIFMNPHAFPSRMTMNQLMECVMGKSCAMSGKFGDSTVFGEWSQNSVKRICDELASHGFEGGGYQTMTSGITGERLHAKIFIGPTYYQRLKHLVSDKYHARARGPMNTMFRQPMSGRSKGGGHRVGEMELHALAAHGTSHFIHERMCKHSDPFAISVCDKCHNFSVSDGYCKSCETTNVSILETSYTSKLLIQELNALCFKTEINTN